MTQTTFSIRYEGLNAADHQIDLDQLGTSLQGFARILAVCAHFVETGRYNKQFNALSVQVYAAPVQEHHCYEVVAHIVSKSVDLGLFQGLGGVVITLAVQYVMNRGKEQEMRYLHDALKQALGQNETMMKQVMDVMMKMADSLAPAAKKAATPRQLLRVNWISRQPRQRCSVRPRYQRLPGHTEEPHRAIEGIPWRYIRNGHDYRSVQGDA